MAINARNAGTEELSDIQTCSNISHETINKRLKKLMRVGPSSEGRKGEKKNAV